jgi:hypothetical protein
MKPSAIAWAAVCLLVVGSGCKAVYAPNIAHTPLLREKGELRATADVRNLQVAYALATHVGVMANAYFRSDDRTLDSGERQEGSGWLVEAAAGWFARTRQPRWLQVEVYAGIGNGHVEHEITSPEGDPRSFEAEGIKLFLMPGMGWTSNYVDLGLSTRLVAVRYTGTKAIGYSDEQLEADEFKELDEQTFLFFEPAVTVRAGYKWIKLQLQIGQSIKIAGGDVNRDKGMITLALNLDLFRTFDE